mgnify:CR=1 FL=1
MLKKFEIELVFYAGKIGLTHLQIELSEGKVDGVPEQWEGPEKQYY